jgi:hypothetical protein
MWTIPLPGGSFSIVIDVALFTVKQGAVGVVTQGEDDDVMGAAVPTVTCETIGVPAASKPVPVRVTVFPPAGAPAFGNTAVTVGTGAWYVYVRLAVVPPGVVTLTFVGPGVLAGIVTVIWISLSTVKHGADGQVDRSIDPTWTSVAPMKFVPARTTLFPPTVGPNVGFRFVSVGPRYVYVSGGVVPPAVVTLTLTPPAACAGTLSTVICVGLSTLKHVPLPHG